MVTTGHSRRWQVTVTLVLVVTLALVVVVGVLRLAQTRSVPLGGVRAAPVQGPGGPTVELSLDASLHPEAESVRELLTRYFTAINTKSYPDWAATVVPARVSQMPETSWSQEYSTTVDGTIRISRIDEQGPGRLLALVSFVSTQRPEKGPGGLKIAQICWRTTMPLVGDPPLIDVSRNGNVLQGPCR